MPKALRKVAGMHTITSADVAPAPKVVLVKQPALRVPMLKWQKELNVISGTMVLIFKTGPEPAQLAQWARTLRQMADDMEKHK